MTKKELIRRSMRALEEWEKLPHEVRWRMMIERGAIDKYGRVLLGLNKEEVEETQPLPREVCSLSSPTSNG